MRRHTFALIGIFAALCLSADSLFAQDSALLNKPAVAHINEALAKKFANGKLRWGGDAEGGAPYQFRSPADPSKLIGFEVEIAEALAQSLSKQLGKSITPEFVQYDWGSLKIGLVSQDDYDIILSGFEVTPENEETVRFTRPYYIFAQQLVARKGETRIKKFEDCLSLPVGTLSGSAAERLLKDRGARNVVPFDGQIEPYLDLENGRLDAVLLDTPIAMFYSSRRPKLAAVGEPIAPGKYAIAVRKDDVALAAGLDRGLGELIESGRMHQIFRKWHLWNDQQAKLAKEINREAELKGLGFDECGQPLPHDASKDPGVELDIAKASADAWTFTSYLPLFLRAARMTVFLTFASMAVAMVIGLIVCICRLYGPPPVRWLALAYVEFFRGVPLLLILTFLYFGMPSFGVNLDGVTTAIVGFGLCYAAYEAEVYRSSISGIPERQWEAGRALGMREPMIFRRVIFPQAIRTALGPITNDFVALFKDTSLVSVIAVRELTKEYSILSRSSFKFVEMGLLTAALYLAMSVPLGYLSRWLEKRWTPNK